MNAKLTAFYSVLFQLVAPQSTSQYRLTFTVRDRCPAQGLFNTDGAGDRTSNLPVTSQLALPPERERLREREGGREG